MRDFETIIIIKERGRGGGGWEKLMEMKANNWNVMTYKPETSSQEISIGDESYGKDARKSGAQQKKSSPAVYCFR